VDVVSSGLQQEGHPATKTLHQLPLMECTFPSFLILHHRPFSYLSRTWWDGAKEDVCRDGESNRNWLIQVHLERWPLIRRVVHRGETGQEPSPLAAVSSLKTNPLKATVLTSYYKAQMSMAIK